MAYVNKFLEHLALETEGTLKSPHRLARFWDRLHAVRRDGGRARHARRSRCGRGREVQSTHHSAVHGQSRPLEAQVRALRSVPALKRYAGDQHTRRDMAVSTRSGSVGTSCSGRSAPTAFRPTVPSAFPTSGVWNTRVGCNGARIRTRSWSAISDRPSASARSTMPKTFASTVRLETSISWSRSRTNLAAEMARQFPPIDTARADRGRVLFYQYCAGCHETFKTDGRMRIYKLFSLDEVGTDPMTAINYERQVMLPDGTTRRFLAAALELSPRSRQRVIRSGTSMPRRSRNGSSARLEAAHSGIRHSARRSLTPTSGTIPAAARSTAPRRLSASGRRRRFYTMGQSRRSSICCGLLRTGR